MCSHQPSCPSSSDAHSAHVVAAHPEQGWSLLCTGAILYAAGLVWMAQATTPLALDLSVGVLVGFGLAGC